MAKIQFGAIATDARGKAGGIIYSRNKGGAYMKLKVSPVQPRTAAQLQVRANFGANAKLWSGTMTESQRAAWTFFAAANPITNVFGLSIILSGLAAQQSLNQVLLQIAEAVILDPPADLSVPSTAAVLSFSMADTGPVITGVTVDTDVQAAVDGVEYYIFMTGALARGQTPNKNAYRYIGAFAPVAMAANIDITAAYLAVFGSVFPSMKTVWMLVSTVNTASGALTPPLKFSYTGA